jgi:hypothetical protein
MAISDFEEASRVMKIISGEIDFNDRARSDQTVSYGCLVPYLFSFLS